MQINVFRPGGRMAPVVQAQETRSRNSETGGPSDHRTGALARRPQALLQLAARRRGQQHLYRGYVRGVRAVRVSKEADEVGRRAARRSRAKARLGCRPTKSAESA